MAILIGPRGLPKDGIDASRLLVLGGAQLEDEAAADSFQE